MSFDQDIKAFYQNKYRPSQLRQIVLPGIGTGIGAVIAASGIAPAWGVWVDLAVPAVDTLIVGVSLDAASILEGYTLDIGSRIGFANIGALTGGTAAQIAAAHRVTVSIEMITVQGAYPFIPFYAPVYIPAGVGAVVRGMTVSGADTIRVTAHCLQLYA